MDAEVREQLGFWIEELSKVGTFEGGGMWRTPFTDDDVRAKALLSRGQWAKHPYVILHELAHAYHDQVLEGGFKNKEVADAYNEIKKTGSYDKVLLYTGRTVKHYALTTPMEYFAESTEAYLGVNDFYPFVRAELKEHDPRMFELLKKIWGEVK